MDQEESCSSAGLAVKSHDGPLRLDDEADRLLILEGCGIAAGDNSREPLHPAHERRLIENEERATGASGGRVCSYCMSGGVYDVEDLVVGPLIAQQKTVGALGKLFGRGAADLAFEPAELNGKVAKRVDEERVLDPIAANVDLGVEDLADRIPANGRLNAGPIKRKDRLDGDPQVAELARAEVGVGIVQIKEPCV
jgi:hypothetical protein